MNNRKKTNVRGKYTRRERVQLIAEADFLTEIDSETKEEIKVPNPRAGQFRKIIHLNK